MKKTLTKIWSMMLVVCMLASMIVLPVSAEGVTAEIILETTNAAPTGSIPYGETLKVNVTGAEPTGYVWYSGNNHQLGIGESFCPPSNLKAKYSTYDVYCVVEYEGGSITTAQLQWKSM